MSEKLKLTNEQIFKILNYRLNDKDEELFSNRFEIVFDDIPSEHPSEAGSGVSRHSYCEKDGREYRWFIVKDKFTNEEFVINSLYDPVCENEVMDLPDNICIVSDEKESSLYVSDCKNEVIKSSDNVFKATNKENISLNETKLMISFLSPELKRAIFKEKKSENKATFENEAEEKLTPAQRLKKEYDKIESECAEFKTNASLSQIPPEKISEVVKFLNYEKDYSFNNIIENIYPICIEYRLNQRSLWQWLQVKRGAWKQK